MTTDELREAYLSFFESKGCVRRPSDVLVPNDPSVLFTPAGMNQFKEQFLGIGKLEFTRATTCQKCIRTGDIENVGKTRFHMTFFEMLGNFSFGDYFKREAIHWAWEFVVRVLALPEDRLSVSVYSDDDEAYGIWREEIGLPSGRIRRCGEEDNFWPAGAPSNGPNGVCGPCSEIFVDLGGGAEVEIWNLVFTQFNRVGYRELEPLPKKNIDTGMGLERAASVVQGKPTAFDTDIFAPILSAVCDVVGLKYDPSSPNVHRLRRMSDHARTVAFCMHENVLPSNEKQGYVVRRLLRRAVLDAYQLGKREAVIHRLIPAVVDAMGKAYPELKQTQASVVSRVKAEEEKFLNTVETGIHYLDSLIGRIEKGDARTISGKDAFTLHATHGFPIELTQELAASRNISVDRAAFDQEMDRHSKISGSAAFSESVFNVGPIHELKDFVAPTEFIGYGEASAEVQIAAIIAQGKIVRTLVEIGHDDPITIVLDRTPFYGESGGQVGDVGWITAPGFRFEVQDTQKVDGYHLHLGHVREGAARIGAKATATIDAVRRAGIQRAHSATHVLHAALHRFLGDHAKQAGSKVENDVLRFDFSHPHAVSPQELARIERWCNERIMHCDPIAATVMPMEEARRLGAMALFGEKYGDFVRVVTMGDFSREFCGGCHLSSTGQVGPFKIVREESVAAGTRRIVALTGLAALDHFRAEEETLGRAAALLRTRPAELPARIEALQNQIKELQKTAQKKRKEQSGDLIGDLISAATRLDGAVIVAAEVEGATADELRIHSDQLRSKEPAIAIILAARENDRVHLIASVSKPLVERGFHAGKWIQEVASVVGGKGGGREAMAQAGGKDPAKLPDALKVAIESARRMLSG